MADTSQGYPISKGWVESQGFIPDTSNPKTQVPYKDATSYADSQKDMFINNGVDAGTKVQNMKKEGMDFASPKVVDMPAGSELFVIGKPVGFNEKIDPQRRLSNYIKTKMSVVDLIPCDYSLDWRKVAETPKNGNSPVNGGIYSISYENKIKDFKSMQQHYGLSSNSTPKAGIRLYTTDDTAAVDSFNVQYKNSIFQSLIDPLSNVGQQFSEIVRSDTSNYEPYINAAGTFAQNYATQKLGKITSEQNAKVFGQLLKSAIDIMGKGNRVSFPKIWQNTTHTSTLSTTIKLVSPYGHPKAIYQFVIKPLVYLLLLAAPHSTDGFSYGGSMPITIKAYGMNYTVLGSISTITARRGGNDTSYNVYRQPLSIDVTIEFQTLFDGFAAYLKSGEKDTSDTESFAQGEKNSAINSILTGDDDPESDLYIRTPKSPLMTVGKILESLKPVDIVEGDFQIYGEMRRPRRINAPGISDPISQVANAVVNTAVNITGNLLGSLNLANFTAAQGAVGSDVISVNNWSNLSTTNSADVFRDKITTNFKTSM